MNPAGPGPASFRPGNAGGTPAVAWWGEEAAKTILFLDRIESAAPSPLRTFILCIASILFLLTPAPFQQNPADPAGIRLHPCH